MAVSRKFQQPRTSRRRLLLLATLAAACYVVSVQVFSGGFPFRLIGGGGDAAKSRSPVPAVPVDMTPKTDQPYQNVFNRPGPPMPWSTRKPAYCARRHYSVLDTQVAPNDKVAIIVDGSDAVELIPVICQFLAILPEWKFVIFHGEANSQKLNSSTILARWAAVGQLRLVRVPDTFSLESEAGVSRLFKDPWLWRQLSEEHVLVFRTDSALCSSSPRNIDDYLHYDFIGAPRVENGKLAYDGGLSIRRRSKMLDAIKLVQERRATATQPADGASASPSPAAAAHGAGPTPDVAAQQDGPTFTEGEVAAPVSAAPAEATLDDDMPEDTLFSEVLADMPGNCLPSPETAAEFSVAREWFEGSLGARALWLWHPPAIAVHFRKRCPDFNLVRRENIRSAH